MKHPMIILLNAAFCLAAPIPGLEPVQAQSIVTLDSEPLYDEPEEEAASGPNCLRTPDHADCTESAASGRSFSLDDVVNLGIIDRSEVEADAGEDVAVETRVEPLPSIDLEILFDYASDELRPDQMRPLLALAEDLEDIDFGRARLVLMGHTDGIGSAAYNRELSLRRANSVAAFLGRTANIPMSRIRTSGMGFDYLLHPDDPAHPANRRVQVLLVE